MAAEYFFVWWDEFDGKDMPSACVKCGKKAKWYECSLTQKNLDTASSMKRKTLVPICDKHKGAHEAVNESFISLSGCTNAGLWLHEPNKAFIKVLEEHRQKEIAAWKEENEGADPADFDENQLPPGLRKAPARPTFMQQAVKNPMMWVAGGLIAFILIFMLCGLCGIVGMTIFGVTR